LHNDYLDKEGVFMKDQEIFIDLTDASLNEWYSLSSLGGKIKYTLWAMFGSDSPLASSSVKIKGTKEQLAAFAAAIAAEGQFMKAIQKHGLNNPIVQNSKSSLARAISDFERDTGIVWPFK
tara:strand:- start:27 stop:389 length:363 start_codon:yes stop_codon:yes gene_type:complete